MVLVTAQKRAGRTALKRALIQRGLWLALLLESALLPRPAWAQEVPIPSGVDDAATTGHFPKKLAITVVSAEGSLPNFEQRVSSWFTDGTAVKVTLSREAEPTQLLASSPGEVRIWVVLLSPGRALVTFSTAAGDTAARYLVREVPLVSGLDDLGLERLASVIHSAFIALREGVEGFEREQAERELLRAGLSVQAPASGSPEMPGLPKPAEPPPARVATVDRAPVRASPPPTSLLFAIGYGGRLRGGEGPGHGPTVALGLQLPSRRGALNLLVSAHYLFRATLDAGSNFRASVQTTAFRAHAGLEPKLARSVFAQLLLGAGADLAQIHASAGASAAAGALEIDPHVAGAQWRGAGELTLGLVRHSELLDLELNAQLSVLFGDVHYSASVDNVETRLLTPWQVEPGLSLQGRFRSAL
jgi:hypothetical protein